MSFNNGWVKSFRKAQNHAIWADKNAWRVFQWILWNVDYETGKGTFGRKQIATGTGIKESTVYKVLGRLIVKYEAISIKNSVLNNSYKKEQGGVEKSNRGESKKVTGTYSTISVLNWARYQQDSGKVAGQGREKEQGGVEKSNTIKEYKNKEEKNNVYNNANKSSSELSELKKSLGVPDVPLNGITQEFQAQAMQIIEALSVPRERRNAYFAAVKTFPRNWILDAYSFAEDHPTRDARDKMFFWKLNDLKKTNHAKSS